MSVLARLCAASIVPGLLIVLIVAARFVTSKKYQSDAFLIEELTDVAQGTGIWLIWVAVERLRSLTGYTGYADSIGGVH